MERMEQKVCGVPLWVEVFRHFCLSLACFVFNISGGGGGYPPPVGSKVAQIPSVRRLS